MLSEHSPHSTLNWLILAHILPVHLSKTFKNLAVLNLVSEWVLSDFPTAIIRFLITQTSFCLIETLSWVDDHLKHIALVPKKFPMCFQNAYTFTCINMHMYVCQVWFETCSEDKNK